jgi:protein gp37
MFNFNWSKWSQILSIDNKSVQVRYHLKTYEVQFKIINSLSNSLHLSQEDAKIVNEVIEEMKQTPKFLLEKL